MLHSFFLKRPQCIDYQYPYFQECNFMLGFDIFNMLCIYPHSSNKKGDTLQECITFL
jgi:hypothetical protein